LFGALLFLGFWNTKLGILGALGSCVTFIMSVTIIPIYAEWLGSNCRSIGWQRSFPYEGCGSFCCISLFTAHQHGSSLPTSHPAGLSPHHGPAFGTDSKIVLRTGSAWRLAPCGAQGGARRRLGARGCRRRNQYVPAGDKAEPHWFLCRSPRPELLWRAGLEGSDKHKSKSRRRRDGLSHGFGQCQ
jgi:hypothetical protein